MKKHTLFLAISLLLFVFVHSQPNKVENDRKTWLLHLDKLARPLLSSLAEGKLKEVMPVQLSKRTDNKENRTKAAYLEAFGRTLSGIAPWLNLEGGTAEEVTLRNQYRAWALAAIKNAVDPTSKDYMQWSGGQPLVDASFFAFALVRC